MQLVGLAMSSSSHLPVILARFPASFRKMEVTKQVGAIATVLHDRESLVVHREKGWIVHVSAESVVRVRWRRSWQNYAVIRVEESFE